MKNKPNPELIDDENPECTVAMLNEAKTAAELFSVKLNNHETVLLSEQALAEDWLKPEALNQAIVENLANE
jgi:hypothetical protein